MKSRNSKISTMATAAVLLRLILIGFFISTAASYSSSTAEAPLLPPCSGTACIAAILSNLGFQDLANAAAAAAANISSDAPTTIFAAADSSLLTCPSCSASLLLQEHSVAGLYSLRFLRRLAFGTKLESLAANRCLTVTASAAMAAARKVFINGVEIVKPDFFNNGHVIVHALQCGEHDDSLLRCAAAVRGGGLYNAPDAKRRHEGASY